MADALARWPDTLARCAGEEIQRDLVLDSAK